VNNIEYINYKKQNPRIMFARKSSLGILHLWNNFHQILRIYFFLIEFKDGFGKTCCQQKSIFIDFEIQSQKNHLQTMVVVLKLKCIFLFIVSKVLHFK